MVDDVSIRPSFGAVSWVKFIAYDAQVAHENVWRAVAIDELFKARQALVEFAFDCACLAQGMHALVCARASGKRAKNPNSAKRDFERVFDTATMWLGLRATKSRAVVSVGKK